MSGNGNEHRRALVRALVISVLCTLAYAAILDWPAIRRVMHFG